MIEAHGSVGRELGMPILEYLYQELRAEALFGTGSFDHGPHIAMPAGRVESDRVVDRFSVGRATGSTNRDSGQGAAPDDDRQQETFAQGVCRISDISGAVAH